MRRIVWIFGIIGGLINGAMFFVLMPTDGQMDFEGGELAGYLTMIVALSVIFFAVKQYKDKQPDGKVGFLKAFLVGLYVTLIASVIYVLAWEVYYQTFAPNFADQYVEYMSEALAQQGKSEAQIAEEIAETASMMETYKNNTLVRMGITFTEIFPVGLIISLLTAATFAFILKPKDKAA